jgi:hypothetical protein
VEEAEVHATDILYSTVGSFVPLTLCAYVWWHGDMDEQKKTEKTLHPEPYTLNPLGNDASLLPSQVDLHSRFLIVL